MTNFPNIQFINNMINISDIYVSITESLLHMINISRCRENSLHYMLAHLDFKDNLIDNYKREILPIFMLADGEHITFSLNLVYVEVISNIKC